MIELLVFTLMETTKIRQPAVVIPRLILEGVEMQVL
jgi:hypothetical protein